MWQKERDVQECGSGDFVIQQWISDLLLRSRVWLHPWALEQEPVDVRNARVALFQRNGDHLHAIDLGIIVLLLPFIGASHTAYV